MLSSKMMLKADEALMETVAQRNVTASNRIWKSKSSENMALNLMNIEQRPKTQEHVLSRDSAQQ